MNIIMIVCLEALAIICLVIGLLYVFKFRRQGMTVDSIPHRDASLFWVALGAIGFALATLVATVIPYRPK